MRASRLRNELSLGTITDEEYHLEIFGRPAPAGAPQLSGTNFLKPADADVTIDTEGVSPNDDPLGRGLRSEEHTSELQSLLRISYAVFCLKNKKEEHTKTTRTR